MRAPTTRSRPTAQRPRKRRPSAKRRYSLAHLINRQPKTIEKHKLYRTMIEQYRLSSLLRVVRIPRKCYTLLNEARVPPENLAEFYRVYRLPKNAFFPLFLTIKRDYFAAREAQAEARRISIRDTIRSLDPPVLALFRYLGYLERHYNRHGESPLWQTELFPSTKKRAGELAKASRAEWIRIFREHLLLIQHAHRALNDVLVQRILALYVLEFPLEVFPPQRPSLTEIKRHYRAVSLKFHPDRGGDPALFRAAKWARDYLEPDAPDDRAPH